MSDDIFYEDPYNSDTRHIVPINTAAPGTDELHLEQEETIPQAPTTFITVPLTVGQLIYFQSNKNPAYSEYINEIFAPVIDGPKCEDFMKHLLDFKMGNTELSLIEIYSKFEIPVVKSVKIPPELSVEREQLVAEMDALLENYAFIIKTYSKKLEISENEDVAFDIRELAYNDDFVTLPRKFTMLLKDADMKGFGLALNSAHAVTNISMVEMLVPQKYQTREDQIRAATNFLNSHELMRNQLSLARWAIGPRSNNRIPNIEAFLREIKSNLQNSSLPIKDLTLPPNLENTKITVPSGLFAEIMLELLGNMAKYGAKESKISGRYSVDVKSGQQFLQLDFIQETPNGKLKPTSSSGSGHELIRGMGVRVSYTDLEVEEEFMVGDKISKKVLSGITRVEIPLQVPIEF